MKASLAGIVVGITVSLLSGCSEEAAKARRGERAGRFFVAGDYEQAKVEYANVLRDDPQSAVAHERLGVMWLEEGVPFRALPYLIRCRELVPENDVVRTKLSAALVAVGRLEEGRQEAFAVTRGSAAHEDALVILSETIRTRADYDATLAELRKSPLQNGATGMIAMANLHFVKGDLESAERMIASALKQDPNSSAVHAALGTLRLKQGDRRGAGEAFKLSADLAPPRSLARLRYAEFIAQSGEETKAIEYLQAMLQRTPDYLLPRRVLVHYHLQKRNLAAAEAEITAMFHRDPASVDGHVLQAKLELAKGEPKKAVERLEKLRETYPAVALISYELARALLAQEGNIERAMAVLSEGILKNPEHLDAAVLLGELYLRTGKAQAAALGMAGLLKNYPQHVPAQNLLAAALRSLGRLDEAAVVVREQLRIMPRNPDFHVLLGTILQQQGKTADAKKSFQEALEVAPDFMPAVTRLVDLEIASQEFDLALAQVQSYRRRSPIPAEIPALEASVYVAQRQWERAESVIEEALVATPNNDRLYNLLNLAYASNKQLPWVLRQVEQVLAKDPANTRALMLSALIYADANEHAKARDAYEKVIELAPNSPVALNNLAYLYSENLQQLDRGCELGKKARALQPDSPVIADTLGWIHFRRKEYSQAVELLKESAGKLPDNPQIQYHLALACESVGEIEAARAAFGRAASSPVDFPGKSEIQQRLASLNELKAK